MRGRLDRERRSELGSSNDRVYDEDDVLRRLRASWQRVLFHGSLAAFGLTCLSSGCAGLHRPPARIVAPPQDALTAPSPAHSDPTEAAVRGAFNPDEVVAVLDDPRLTSVRAAYAAEAYGQAATELASALASPSAPVGDERAAWSFVLGQTRALAGDPLGAARAYDEASAAPSPLRDHARFAAAELLERANQYDDAIARVRALPADFTWARDANLILAQALAGKHDIDGASALWRAHLAQERPSNWVTISLQFGRALLEHPSEEHAEEAIALARRVIYGARGAQGVGEAREIEQRALGAIPFARRKTFEQPTHTELLLRAQALVSSRQFREALKVTDGLIALAEGDRPGELPCEAWMVRSEALSGLRKRPEAADAYDSAIDRCAGLERRAWALFSGGRASARAGRWSESVQRYARVEQEFPKHRLADDSRLRGAGAYRELGDEARYQAMLASMPDDYPEGDMVNDALFELALARIETHDWAGAIAPLERGHEHAGRERAYDAAGRFPYYLGRAHLETGSLERGRDELASVVRDHPLSFYMTLALSRLAARDRAHADGLLAEMIAREPPGPFMIARGPALTTPEFIRATWLVRVGEPKLARAELDRLGLSAGTAAPELLWAGTFLLAHAGAAKESHNLLRGASMPNTKVPDSLAGFLDHYPAGAWRAAWEVAFPRPFLDIVSREAARQGIPRALAYAIMREESAFEPRVTSAANAIGLMQLILPTAKTMAKSLKLPSDAAALKRPEINIALGCRYLSVLRQQFSDNPLLAIPGYNAGGGAPKKWLAARPTQDFDVWVERIPYEETRQYTKRVLTSMAAYAFLYGEDHPHQVLSMPIEASPSAKAAALVASVP
jgi:soluble lytic murein transglycosylase